MGNYLLFLWKKIIKILSGFYHLHVIINTMFHFLAPLIHNLQAIVEHGGYLLLFITTYIEGIPIVGQFIPGHTIVLISGFLAKLGVLKIYKVLIIVIVGATLGDVTGFLLGKKYGFNLLIKISSYFSIKKEYIERVRVLINENTIKTIILGRFSPITRPLSPFIVGASGIDAKKFWFFDILSVVLWSSVSVAIGYIFGASYHTVSVALGKYILLAIIIGVLIIWVYRFVNKQFHIFAKYELITLAINMFGLYLFFKTIQDALTDKVSLLALDFYVNDFFFAYNTDIGLNLMNIITNIFSPYSLSILGLIGILFFIRHRKYYFALISFFSLGGGYVFVIIIKNIVLRLRPLNASILETGYSFPSGHAVAATIFFFLLVYFFVIKIHSIVVRETLIAASVITVLLVAFSRVYLGVHWLSDVLAGIGLGLFWVTLIILLFKYLHLISNAFRKINR